ncbi:MAG: hypothetical protein WB502_09570 [Thermoactinomyces sp.]
MVKDGFNIGKNIGQINISHGGTQKVSQTVNLGQPVEDKPEHQLVEALQRLVAELEKLDVLTQEKKEEVIYDFQEAADKVSNGNVSTGFLSILNTKLQNLNGLATGSATVCQIISTAIEIIQQIKG